LLQLREDAPATVEPAPVLSRPSSQQVARDIAFIAGLRTESASS
jgi:hypothetical protein